MLKKIKDLLGLFVKSVIKDLVLDNMEYFRYINTPDPSTMIVLSETDLSNTVELEEFKQWVAPSEGWIGMRCTATMIGAMELQFKNQNGQYPCALLSAYHADGSQATEGMGFLQKVSKGQILYFLRRRSNGASIFFYRCKS